jgi:hypothetical protein
MHQARMCSTSLLVMVAMVAMVAMGSVAGCTDDDEVCTTEFVSGLRVEVEDEDGNRLCDAAVRAVDGDYQEELELVGGADDCFYEGAGERAGRYTVTIEKADFQTASMEVLVTEGECHVETETRAVTLQSAL